jgi:hypothetical protein
VSGGIGERAQANKCDASYPSVNHCIVQHCITMAKLKDRSQSLPTIRHGVQSSHSALSCSMGLCAAAVETPCPIALACSLGASNCRSAKRKRSLLQAKCSDAVGQRAADAGNPCRRASSHSLSRSPPKPAPLHSNLTRGSRMDLRRRHGKHEHH